MSRKRINPEVRGKKAPAAVEEVRWKDSPRFRRLFHTPKRHPERPDEYWALPYKDRMKMRLRSLPKNRPYKAPLFWRLPPHLRPQALLLRQRYIEDNKRRGKKITPAVLGGITACAYLHTLYPANYPGNFKLHLKAMRARRRVAERMTKPPDPPPTKPVPKKRKAYLPL